MKLLPPERRLGNFPQLSARQVHVLLRHRALSGLCSEVVSVIVNTFFVASPLIARQDQEIASPVVNLVIGGLIATRSLVLGPQEVILILTNSYVDEQSK